MESCENVGIHAGTKAVSKIPAVKLPIIDLFAGVGGLSLGAARAGFHIALAVENDPHAKSAHELNFPKVEHSAADISGLKGEELLQNAGLDLGGLCGLIGGPPCQGFSTIGRRKPLDGRNNLFRKFFELVSATKPTFFVAENVPGILDPKYDAIRAAALACIEREYTVTTFRLRASDFGAPTSRERVFFIGFRSNFNTAIHETEFADAHPVIKTKVADALVGLPAIRAQWQSELQGWRKIGPLPDTYYGRRISACIPKGIGDPVAVARYASDRVVSGCLGTIHLPEVRTRFSKLKPGEKDGPSKATRLKLDGFCPTLRAGTGSDKGSYQAVRPIHPTMPRVISPREAARLQGFPDWFQFAPSKWHSFRQIGNSVSPFVSEAVLTLIANKLRRIHRA